MIQNQRNDSKSLANGIPQSIGSPRQTKDLRKGQIHTSTYRHQMQMNSKKQPISSIGEDKSIQDLNIDINSPMNMHYDFQSENIDDTHRVHEGPMTGESPFREF